MSSSEKRKPYPFDELEPRWQRYWAEHRTFRAPNPGDADFDPVKPKFYVLDMFPYPSGSGLHVGHPEGYTATDIVSRQRRMRGFNVLHPMGWDAFGLPAEQYAVKTGQHPRATTEANVAVFRAQLTRLGFDYDWPGREVNTTDPAFFKWTQWIFTVLYNSWFNPATNRAESIDTYPGNDKDLVRLAYVAEAPVNWCPGLGTVLANEEVIDGMSEVGGFPVERRPMRQWMLRITAYAQRLIDELAGLDWPESIKLLQKNWIGRSEGAKIYFDVADYRIATEVTWMPISAQPPPVAQMHAVRIGAFTTRPDTLFGATYMVLAPEHLLVTQITTSEQRREVLEYRERTRRKSDRDRIDATKEKTGVFTGAYAINPANGKRIPIWIADYVLARYGTGAIMAVPAHDERDWEFAEKYKLPKLSVAKPIEGENSENGCFIGEGIAINSQFLDGLPTEKAKRKIIDWLEETECGQGTVNYKLGDWLFSRQRYWGEPFPVVWENGRHRVLPENELPVEPPALEDFKPTGTAEPPLAKAHDWVKYSDAARRETNTMPQWAGSSWYYLRFCDPHNAARFVGAEAERYWMDSGRPGGVDLYVGGTEHAVLHLLYARFWHKVLFDRGCVSTPEPFQRLVNQGLILGEDGQKMSKSRGNVVNPEEVVAEFGADSLRLFEMFMGPLEQTKPWSTAGVQGVHRFLARVWRLCMEEDQEGRWQLSGAVQAVEPTSGQLRTVHATIKKVSADIDALAFNTAISAMMVCVNEFTAAPVRPASALRTLLVLLNPFAPHLTEELNARLGERFPDLAPPGKSLAHTAWPTHDEAILAVEEIELPVQINGKLRDRITVKKGAAAAEVEAAALAAPKVAEHLAGRAPRKVIVVPGKLVNVVVA